MNAVINTLKQRNASNKLIAPAPSASELDEIFAAAVRAPDHGLLRPWRFICIQEGGLDSLGELFVAATEHGSGQLTQEKREKLAAKPHRAPLIIVVVANIQAHEKIPEIEQQHSAACAAQNILLAAESLAYASIWRTGAMAFNDQVKRGLGLSANEQIVGFLYVGTAAGARKPLPIHALDDFVSHWQ